MAPVRVERQAGSPTGVVRITLARPEQRNAVSAGMLADRRTGSAAGSMLGIASARLGIVLDYENIERLVLAVGPKRAGEAFASDDLWEGIEAFRQRRKPRFKGS
jgi:enoyl-CoA hydratase/carnithine racemase